MKAMILCGGQGTRIRDVSEILPKPMLPIGDKPILWHIMKIYASYGIKDFVLCLGYKGWTIKEFFLNYSAKTSDITCRLGDRDYVTYHNKSDEADWTVTLADTGESSLTGKRVWEARRYLDEGEDFCLTYGDGVADVDVDALIKTHKESSRPVTITGVQPMGRFGEIELDGDAIREFNEKPNVSSGLINGGFMVMNHKALKTYFDEGKNLSLESDVLPKIVKDKQATIYAHKGSWQCIDTPREYDQLNRLWDEGRAFWRKA